MNLPELFSRLERTWIGDGIQQSTWLFPALEATHLLGLALIGGSVLVVDLRLLGAGLRCRAVAQVIHAARPWLLGSIAVMFATGVPLFLSEAVSCYYNTSFRVKMGALACVLVFTFAIKHPLATRAPPRSISARDPKPAIRRRHAQAALGVVSIGLWLTVAAAGRWIAFSG